MYFFRFNVYLLISFQCLLIPFNNIVVSLTPFRHLYTKQHEIHFSFYYDFEGDESLTGTLLEDAYEEILERITQDIFNASVAKW